MERTGREPMIVACVVFLFGVIVAAYAVGYFVARERYLPLARSEYTRGIEDGRQQKMLDCYRDPAPAPPLPRTANVEAFVATVTATAMRCAVWATDKSVSSTVARDRPRSTSYREAGSRGIRGG